MAKWEVRKVDDDASAGLIGFGLIIGIGLIIYFIVQFFQSLYILPISDEDLKSNDYREKAFQISSDYAKEYVYKQWGLEGFTEEQIDVSVAEEYQATYEGDRTYKVITTVSSKRKSDIQRIKSNMEIIIQLDEKRKNLIFKDWEIVNINVNSVIE
ncbi:hypothetical protein V7138_15005 [Bacillus sp. JJ1533]|uniref:hypothetical protein n=1 Tax=Bacillus sp. JJ1533 TaxID=3122959 RepID=UPI002FFEED8F